MTDSFREIFKNNIIRASAGTGKTFQLSNRYLRLLASGVSCETILAVTFTRKGAGEILDRIVQRLAAAALDQSSAAELASQLDWKLDQSRAAAILHELLKNLHHLEIGTLDSFFNRVAKAFSLELGLPPTWEISELQQIEALQDESIQAILHHENIGDLLNLMEKGEAQRRIATLIRDTVNRIYTLFRQSTPTAWNQLQRPTDPTSDEQLAELVEQIKAIRPNITQASFKAHWEEKIEKPAGDNQWLDIVDTTTFQNFIDGNLTYRRMKFLPEMSTVFRQIQQHATTLFIDQLIWRNTSTCQLLELFADHLERLKDEKGKLGFDDVTNRLTRFVGSLDTEQFAFRLDHQIQHLLLDEFQDTSLNQWNVIRPFALNATQDDPQRSFYCVGDLKQAIYRWRGGVAEIFDLIEQELPNITEGQSLSKSYRSAPTIIALVNDVFSNLAQYQSNDEITNQAVQSWSKWFETHDTAKTFEGYASIEIAKDCSDQLKRGSGDKRESVTKSRNRNVIDSAFQQIVQLHRDLPEQLSIGVLFRTNGSVADMIFRLQRAGIPASEEGGTPITDSAAVELVLSALQLADHPSDSVARFHVAHSPLASAFDLAPETAANQEDNRLAVEPGAAQLRQSLVLHGYGPAIEKMALLLIPHCTRRETLRLQQLVRVAFSADKDQDRWKMRPATFVNFIRDEVKVSDESSARIRVMTIHQAKGLEFDALVLPMEMAANDFAPNAPDVVAGRDGPTDPINIITRYVGTKKRKLLPKRFQEIFDREREATVREAMCLLYVALTRAVHSVHIILSFGAKPDHKSAEAILLATLCPESAVKGFKRKSGIVFEQPGGNKTWYQNETEQADQADQADPSQVFYLPPAAELNRNAVATVPRTGRGRTVNRATRIGTHAAIRLGEIFERRDDAEATRRGTAIHACFELVRWLDFGQPDVPTLKQHLQRVAPWSDNHSDTIDQFSEMLAQPAIENLLTRQTYLQTILPEFIAPPEVVVDAYRLEVQTERAFAVAVDNQIMHGKIDRIVLVYEADRLVAADIIDFKTDSADSQNDPQLQTKYRQQIDNYRRAASRFTQLPMNKIAGRLVFLESGTLIGVGGQQPSPTPSVVPPPKRGSHQMKLWRDG